MSTITLASTNMHIVSYALDCRPLPTLKPFLNVSHNEQGREGHIRVVDLRSDFHDRKQVL